MNTSLIKVNIDSDVEVEVSKLFKKLGLDMSTAINIFLKKCLQEGNIPFDLQKKKFKNMEGMQTFWNLQNQAEKNNLNDMTLKEINAEISAARKKRRVGGLK